MLKENSNSSLIIPYQPLLAASPKIFLSPLVRQLPCWCVEEGHHGSMTVPHSVDVVDVAEQNFTILVIVSVFKAISFEAVNPG